MGQITLSASDAEVLRENEHFSRLIDRFVMTVTEGLCTMESETGHVAQDPEVIARKARILAGLDNLDRLMARYQNRIMPEGPIPSSLPHR